MKNAVFARVITPGTKEHDLETLLERDLEFRHDKNDKDYDYKPSKTWQKIQADPAMMKLVIGPYGCGKTFGAVRYEINKCISQPAIDGEINWKVLLIRNTYTQIKRTLVPSVIEAWPYGLPLEWRAGDMCFDSSFDIMQEGKHVRVNLEMQCQALNLPEDEQNLKSLNVSSLLACEASEIPFYLLTAAMGRTGRYPRMPSHMKFMSGILETNNFHRSHPLYKFFIAKTLESKESEDGLTKSVHYFPSGDSPEAENLENMQLGYYQRLEDANGKEWADVYIRNQHGSSYKGRLVYRNFNPQIHVIDKIKADTSFPIEIGIDAGRDSAYVVAQRTNKGLDIICCVCCENEPLGVAASAAIDDICRFFPPKLFKYSGATIDPGSRVWGQGDNLTGLQLVQDAFNKYNVPVRVAYTNDLNTRIEAVNNLFSRLHLGDPLIRICGQKAHKLVAACEMYHYREIKINTMSGDKIYANKPEKDMSSHPAEALQYLVLGNYGYTATANPSFTGGRNRVFRPKVKHSAFA